jgi:uncharacterized membrane protein YgdD (TMEM256/DUF423 family)
MGKLLLAAGAVSALISVAAGAFGAHGLKGRLSEYHLGVFETAARYQMYHALALVLIGVLAAGRPSGALSIAGGSMIAGTLIFSGSLYVLALTDMKWLGAITPLGGLAFMIGWALLAYAALKA